MIIIETYYFLTSERAYHIVLNNVYIIYFIFVTYMTGLEQHWGYIYIHTYLHN